MAPKDGEKVQEEKQIMWLNKQRLVKRNGGVSGCWLLHTLAHSGDECGCGPRLIIIVWEAPPTFSG